MTDTRHPNPASVPLAHLLTQAAAELNAQPAPPMPRALFDALPEPVLVPSTATATRAHSARHGWLHRLARWAPRHASAGSRPPRAGWPTAAAACSLMLVSVTVLLALALPPGAADPKAMPGFIPVAPQERWSRLQDDGGAAWVVTTELPQARLASYGLPFDPAHAADTVRAELLMRASGEVLAVRVLY